MKLYSRQPLGEVPTDRTLTPLEIENAALRLVAAGKLASPARRRELVTLLQRRLGLSERAACRALGHPRPTQRYQPRRPVAEADVVVRLHALSDEHPEYGHRRLAALLAAEGWLVSRRSVERLCRAEGIQASPKAQACIRKGPVTKASNASRRVLVLRPVT